MNSKFILRLCAIALVLWLLKMGWDRVEGDDGMMLVYFFTVGLAVGLLIVKYVLPAFGDAVGTMVYSSGEKVQPTESHKAAAKVAQGDYEGAIAEHEKSLSADPSQTYPIAEIAQTNCTIPSVACRFCKGIWTPANGPRRTPLSCNFA
jgi:hypothetical protein